MRTNLTERSKKLSYLLRHKPESAGLHLDKEGWCELTEFLSKTDFTFEELTAIIENDAKGRYTLQRGLKVDYIRANQGHTVNVKITFEKAVPPALLYHGTALSLIPVLEKQGLKPMERHHVHLSSDLATAQSVSSRRKGQTVVINIDAKAMVADGFQFFISTNGGVAY